MNIFFFFLNFCPFYTTLYPKQRPHSRTLLLSSHTPLTESKNIFFIFVRDEIPNFCKESTPPDYFSGFAETGVYGWRIRFLGY